MREDEALVDRLAAELTKQGATVWRDRDAIEPGESWRAAITHAIRDGTYFLACFSRHYESRPDTYLNEELSTACAAAPLRSGVWMIPVNLDGCSIPLFTDERRLVNEFQQVSLYPNWAEGVARIVEATIRPTKLRLKEETTHHARELAELAVRLHRAETDLEHAQGRAIEEEVSRSIRPSGSSHPGSLSPGGMTPGRVFSDLSGYHERVASAKARFAEKRSAYDQKVKNFLDRYDEEFDPFPKMQDEIEARKRRSRKPRNKKSATTKRSRGQRPSSPSS
jgi:hypothetical protein